MSDLELRRALNVLLRYLHQLDDEEKKAVVSALGGFMFWWVELDDGGGEDPVRLYYVKKERALAAIFRNVQEHTARWTENIHFRDEFVELWAEDPNEAIDAWNFRGEWPKITWGDAWLNP